MKKGYSIHTQDEMVKFRLNHYHKDRLLEKSRLYHVSLSEILREAIVIWLNMNTPKEVK